jgi:hypothetical protein
MHCTSSCILFYFKDHEFPYNCVDIYSKRFLCVGGPNGTTPMLVCATYPHLSLPTRHNPASRSLPTKKNGKFPRTTHIECNADQNKKNLVYMSTRSIACCTASASACTFTYVDGSLSTHACTSVYMSTFFLAQRMSTRLPAHNRSLLLETK